MKYESFKELNRSPGRRNRKIISRIPHLIKGLQKMKRNGNERKKRLPEKHPFVSSQKKNHPFSSTQSNPFFPGTQRPESARQWKEIIFQLIETIREKFKNTPYKQKRRVDQLFVLIKTTSRIPALKDCFIEIITIAGDLGFDINQKKMFIKEL